MLKSRFGWSPIRRPMHPFAISGKQINDSDRDHDSEKHKALDLHFFPRCFRTNPPCQANGVISAKHACKLFSYLPPLVQEPAYQTKSLKSPAP